MKQPKYYSTYSVLAAAALYFAWNLSRSGRGTIDWIVLGLVSAALLYNLAALGRRLYKACGAKALWHLQRTLLFWIVGLFNTLLLRPEDSGSWKNIVGWLFIALAAADSIALHLKERSIQSSRIQDREHLPPG